jgi:hypothetical protein
MAAKTRTSILGITIPKLFLITAALHGLHGIVGWNPCFLRLKTLMVVGLPKEVI